MRKMRIPALISVAIVTLCVFACAQNEKMEGGVHDRIKEFSDPSRTVEVAVGERFSILLDSNPTTGYSWQMTGQAAERAVVLTVSSYEAPRKNLAGAPGRQRLTFRAESVGIEKLAFHYLRPWEKNTEPARTVTFTVVVK